MLSLILCDKYNEVFFNIFNLCEWRFLFISQMLNKYQCYSSSTSKFAIPKKSTLDTYQTVRLCISVRL